LYHRIIVTILLIQFGLAQDTTTADQIEDPFEIVEEDTATYTVSDTILIPIPELRDDKDTLAILPLGKPFFNYDSDIKQLQLPIPQTGYADNIYWVFGLVLGSAMAQNSTQVIKKLGLAGIGCRPFFWPMNLQPVFQKMGLFSGETYPVAEKLGDRGFYIPSGMALTDDEANLTAEKLRQIIES